MILDSDPGLWKQISSWMWAILALPIATLWRRSENSVQKDEFRAAIEDAQRDRKEIRENVIKIFDKIDNLKDDMNDKTVRLMSAINEKADR